MPEARGDLLPSASYVAVPLSLSEAAPCAHRKARVTASRYPRSSSSLLRPMKSSMYASSSFLACGILHCTWNRFLTLQMDARKRCKRRLLVVRQTDSETEVDMVVVIRACICPIFLPQERAVSSAPQGGCSLRNRQETTYASGESAAARRSLVVGRRTSKSRLSPPRAVASAADSPAIAVNFLTASHHRNARGTVTEAHDTLVAADQTRGDRPRRAGPLPATWPRHPRRYRQR